MELRMHNIIPLQKIALSNKAKKVLFLLHVFRIGYVGRIFFCVHKVLKRSASAVDNSYDNTISK